MGAWFIYEVRPGVESKEQVRTWFQEASEADAWEKGHSYSGGWNMCTGVSFPDVPTFATELEAYDWVADRAQKWEAALAVRFVAGGPEDWFIGGWAAS